MTLTEFLLARIAEDEDKIANMTREKQRVDTAPAYQSMPTDWLTAVDIFVSPDRWRAECEAKRRIVNAYQLAEADLKWSSGYPRRCGTAALSAACSALRYAAMVLAVPYADHPDYDETWRPGPPTRRRERMEAMDGEHGIGLGRAGGSSGRAGQVPADAGGESGTGRHQGCVPRASRGV